MDSRPVKIVSLIPYRIFPAKLGGEKGIAVFNEHLAQETPLVSVTTRNNDPAYAKGYRLLNILSNRKARYFNPLLYFRLRRILRAESATHLLIEHPYFGWLAWLLRKTLPIQWVVHSHNIEYMRSRSIGRWWWKCLQWYEGWVYRHADTVFFISEDDRQHALSVFGLQPSRSIVVTYGIEQAAIPDDIDSSREKIRALHGIEGDEKILLFNGALYHPTNYDALNIILEEINPLLLADEAFRYKILVCGRGLPDFFGELRDYATKNIIYAGFVDDISLYFKAADVFLNPILTGGGVKTKAIEALAMNCAVISTELGAMGINRSVCGSKLQVVKAGEWKEFSELVIAASARNDSIPSAFFEYYYWGNIVRGAVSKLRG